MLSTVRGREKRLFHVRSRFFLSQKKSLTVKAKKKVKATRNNNKASKLPMG